MDMEAIRDRVKELRKVPSEELLDHDGNYRQHPQAQKNVFRGVVEQIGIAGALVAYESERNGGKLTVIDGHMRKNDFPTDWPVLVTDLNDEEADLLLQAYDPVSAMATMDQQRLAGLMEKVQFDDASVRVMLDSLMDTGALPEAAAVQAVEQQAGQQASEETIPEMELQPYEHYDYVLVLARNVMDWNYLVENLGLKKVDGSPDPRYKKIGLGRAIPADKLIALMQELEELRAKVG